MRAARRKVAEIVPGVPNDWPNLLLRAPGYVCEAFGPLRMGTMLKDAELFFQIWAPVARRLNWKAIDLFGVHPAAPASRFDEMGLMPLLYGSTVRQLRSDGAVLASVTGWTMTFQRKPLRYAVLIWNANQASS